MSSPTIKDVAKLAGVSISTVSRVMNNSKPVSPESRRKVEDAIKKLDFKRNELARSLVMKRSNLIGVLVEDLGIPYMAQIVRGVEEVGRMYKYDMLLNSSYGDSDQEKAIVDFMLRKQAEAIILITENVNPEVIVKLKENDVSFILLDKFYTGPFNTVAIDYEDAAYKMTEFLIEEDHKDILFIGDSQGKDMSNPKAKGYKQAISDYKLENRQILSSGSDFSHGYKLGEDILASYESKISSIFASTDELALGIIHYLNKHGVRVPDDISVVGFGDMHISNQYTPSLTTIHEPNYDIGAVAMRRVIKELKEEENIDSNVFLPIQIMKRDSVKKVK